MKDHTQLKPDEVLVDCMHLPIDEQREYIARIMYVPVLEGKRVILQHDSSIDLKSIQREVCGR